MPDSSEGLGATFLDEFYAECDEHLTALRHALARLAEAPSEPVAGNEAWERLLREMHSLKGIMGMAGLERPERMAHATEDYLRALSGQPTPPTEEQLEALERATEGLEHVLAAHRQQQPLPDVSSIMDALRRLAPSPPAAASTPPTPPVSPEGADARLQARLQRARQAGKQIWRFLFTPSAQLNQRGVNVNEVRARLQSLGDLLHSAPQIRAQGAITFEFLVAVERAPSEAAPWSQDGISLEAVEPPQTEPTRTGGPAPADSPVAPPPHLSSPAYVAPSHVVRVDLERLDELMQAMGEMVVYRARLEETLARVRQVLPAVEARSLQELNSGFARELRRLREGLMRVRLVPLAEVFDRMALVARDIVRESGRKIRLTLHGKETKIDKYIVERLKDPLLHLVRNAATHALEPAPERGARGKPEALTIALRASTVGESVLIEVQDDGPGLDVQKIRARSKPGCRCRSR
jgi:two-component system, chemotaxis family, sensor kinase CheA